MRIIALEEHFVTPLYQRATRPRAPRNRPCMTRASRRSATTSMPSSWISAPRASRRWTRSGIDLQVLSLTQPGAQAFAADIAIPMARDANDRVAAAVKAHPTRFAGFAALATAAPAEAAKELERCVKSSASRAR